MAVRLVSLDHHEDITLDRIVVVVGRHDRCDVRISSPQVSRRHCCLTLDGAGILVRDLGSSNGTRINGRSIEQGVLQPGDVLSIAHRRYQMANPGPDETTSGARGPDSHEPGGPPQGEIGSTLQCFVQPRGPIPADPRPPDPVHRRRSDAGSS